jgi:D-serine deaminase-like pyridoxal phosphate-dependent protein
MEVSTGEVEIEDQALQVLAEVCSIYIERNEALINAGVLGLTREINSFPGFAKVIDSPNWHVGEISQEHGILSCGQAREDVTKSFSIGDLLLLHVSHSCITAAAYSEYFVVDEEDIIREVWYPWKGW